MNAEDIRRLLSYEPLTGELTWRQRTPDMFVPGKRTADQICNMWNGKHAGKQAGTASLIGYRYVHIENVFHKEHRLIWLHVMGDWPISDIDHIDGDKSNNAIHNLRLASRSQNCANTKIRKDNGCGFKGVSYHSQLRKYQARIQINGRSMSLGCFETPEQAHEAYVKAARSYFGAFARFL